MELRGGSSVDRLVLIDTERSKRLTPSSSLGTHRSSSSSIALEVGWLAS